MGEGILTSFRRWLGGPAIEPAGGPERSSETGWSADAGTVGRIAISADGRLLRVNGAFCRLTGHAEAELLGRRVAEITHPDDRRADAIEADRLLRGDAATFTREKRLVRKDGGVRWATVTARLARGADGAPARIEGEVVDVTDRRRVEEALREQEARYRAMFETAVDAVLVIDARGAIRSANPAVERLFGHAPSELVGRNVSVLMPADHAGAHDGHLARYAAGAERRIIGIGREVEARRRDGSLFPAELSVAEWEAGGERFYTGTLRDVSARRAAEAATRQERDRAQSYLQVAGVMLLVLDRDGRIETVNQRGAEILGHADPTSLIGRDWFDLAVPPGERDAVRAIFAQFMTGAAEAPERVEGLIRRTDGSERLIAWRNTTLRDAQGRIVGTISSGEDVTEARGAEARLRESEARLRFVLESSPDTIFLQDRDLRYVWVVHAAPPFDAEQVLG